MKRTEESNVKNLSKLGKMFVCIALRQLRANSNTKFRYLKVEELGSGALLVAKLVELGVVQVLMNGDILVTVKGGKLVKRYFAACAEELKRGRFGKMKWDKRSEFHRMLLARIA